MSKYIRKAILICLTLALYLVLVIISIISVLDAEFFVSLAR